MLMRQTDKAIDLMPKLPIDLFQLALVAASVPHSAAARKRYLDTDWRLLILPSATQITPICPP